MTHASSIADARTARGGEPPRVSRYHGNPILVPGRYPWRAAVSFNPGVVDVDGRVYLFERAAGSLRPFKGRVGLWYSDDGLSFEPVSETPVFAPEQMGYPDGAIEDPRVVHIDGRFYMSFAFRPYAYHCNPTGLGVPDYAPMHGTLDVGINHTRSAIAVSDNLTDWEFVEFTTEPEVDDRDNVLFPERIDGRFALLRRPKTPLDAFEGRYCPGIWLTCSEDDTFARWTEPRHVAGPIHPWEGTKIGAAGPPLRTEHGWLLLYHGVDSQAVYRVGAMLLDGADPARVIARAPMPIMSPEHYYECFGLVIPNVIFPTGTMIRGDDLYIYYGCADTCIAVAFVSLSGLCDYLLSHRLQGRGGSAVGSTSV
ncbi:MAG: glycosidase [Phycisphaeraceae bacterium]